MAAPIKPHEYVQDIRKPVLPRQGGGLIFTGDADADAIIVKLYDGKNEYPVSGSVTMRCIRADGVTEGVEGSVSGNTVQATLKQACCAVPGPLTVTLSVTADGVTSTILKVVYTVDATETGVIGDPGTIIPDVAALIDAIETAIGSIPAEYSDLLHAIAKDYTDLTFPVSAGAYCWYGGTLYRAKADIPTSESWTAAHWQAAVICDEIAEVKSALYPYNARDVFSGALTRVSETKNNVTFSWSGEVCTVSTTSVGASAVTVNIMLEPSPLPEDIIAGQRYKVVFGTTSENVYLRFLFYDAGENTTPKYISDTGEDGWIMTIPDGTVEWSVGLFVDENVTLDSPATISDIHLISARTNAELTDDINTAASSLKSGYNTDDYAGFAAAGNVVFVPAWEKNRYIDENTGEVETTELTRSVTEAIRIPDGSKAIVSTYTTPLRYATYDENGNMLNVYVDQFGINIEIPSTNGKYFRLQYPSVTDTDLESVTFRFEYDDGIARKSDIVTLIKNTNDNGFSNENAAITGNPVVIRDASSDASNDISVSDGTEGEVLSLCGKNIFNFQHKSRLGLISNGVTFGFNMTTQEYTITSTNGATATAVSANNTCVGCLTLDGVDAYHNFHFRMKADTPVTITPGYAYEPYYDDKIEMLLMYIVNGSLKTIPIGYEGATIIASAGVEYGIRLRVAAGWQGSTTMRPQIEIGGEGTAFERYRGVDLPLPLSAGSNLFNMPEVARLKSIPNAYVTATFDYINQSVLVESTGPASNTLVTNNSYDGKVNNNDWFYLSKFTPGAIPVLVPGVPEELVGMVAIFVSDGTTNVVQNATANPVVFMGESGKEYGYRIRVNAGAKFKYLFKPVIATGAEMLKQMGTHYPVTSIYTNGGATVSVTYNKAKLSDEILSTAQIAKGVAKLTGGKIVNALDKLTEAGSVVCFIDDDTTSPTFVQRFHDIFAAEGVVGNYAVEMENVDNYPNDLPEMLLEYERQGFGMLYHCYKQHGDADRYWESGNPMYDEDLIRTNFYRGLREFKQIGFNSARYWVTPYGVDDQFIQNLAKEADMECLLSCPTATYAGNSILSLGSNVKRYNMPRAIFLSNPNNDWQIKTLIDGCASAPGMLVIVSHVNSWAAEDVETIAARLTGLIQYAKAAGCKIQNFMTAYQTFKPLLMLNELF